MRNIFICILFLLASIKISAQVDKYANTYLHPVSPTAFQFIKYTEMPVSEYTGIPNISIPLYEINVDGVKIPIQLTYHSNGIRVSQEASWVGLGWDLTMGSIIQTINDRDDYGIEWYTGQPNVKLIPDFFPSSGDGSPFKLPMIWIPNDPATHGYGWTSPYPINQPTANQGFAIATKYGVPVNGDFNQEQTDLFTTRWYDSEPDIFCADFLGENIKFIVDFKTQHLVVLNKGGYILRKTTNGFQIINPTGTQFFFELKSAIENNTQSLSIDGVSSDNLYEPVSNIFFLTKIITKNGKNITFQYTTTNTFDEFPNYSDKSQSLTNKNVGMGSPDATFTNLNSSPPAGSGAVLTTVSINREQYSYLSSITFPNGEVTFSLSDRTDIDGGKKLDKIQIINSNSKIVKSWQFNYSYFDASSINGNGYTYANGNDLTNEVRTSQRLKLLNIQEENGGKYIFSYNSTPLPKKNSFAADYWGFYNGQLTNTSMLPNPTTLGHSELGNNYNVKDANLSYAEAGVLNSIQYPTGGNVSFEYELNQFDASQMIGLPSSSLINGCGLRIKSITHSADGIVQSLKTTYEYAGGKLINDMRILRQLPYIIFDHFDFELLYNNSYTLTEITANSVFSSNPLSSINSVGYDQVTKSEVSRNNLQNGKVVTEFYNNIDSHNPTIETRALHCNIPPVKSYTFPENGTVKSQTIYDGDDKIKKTISDTYSVISSPIYYGARILGYGNLNWTNIDNGTTSMLSVPQNLIGYYPIFDIETLPSTSVTTEYDNNNKSITTTKSYSFDSFDQLTFEQSRTSTGGYNETYYTHAYDPPDNSLPANTALLSANRLTELSEILKEKRPISYNPPFKIFDYKRNFEIIGNLIVPSQITVNDAPETNSNPHVITYDQYDNNGNLLQYTKDGEVNSVMWDYNGEYVVAEIKNSSQADVAYTSFEATGKGNWTYSGTPSLSSGTITGSLAYLLSSGAITKSGLTAGKKYVVSYWSKGAVSVTGGTIGNSINGKSVNGWQYHEVTITGATSVSISGSVYIDELRLYPYDAQMTTYTYEPLIGITSICGIDNTIQYYEYDGFARLQDIKDEDGNIIRTFEYHYKQ